jgi:hypothetical protein
MCTDHYTGYTGCKGHGYDLKECEPKNEQHTECNLKPDCKTIERDEWVEGYCNKHLEKMKPDSRKKQEAIIENRYSKWAEQGGRKVWSYESERPSRWKSQQNCIVM